MISTANAPLHDAAFLAAVMTGLLTLLIWVGTQYQAGRDRRRKVFAEALVAIEKYGEVPWRIRRRPDSKPDTRSRLSDALHEIQEELMYYQGLLSMESPIVGSAYSTLVKEIRGEAGRAMSEAWSRPLIKKDAEMSGQIKFDATETARARLAYIRAVRRRLRPLPFRWLPIRAAADNTLDIPRKRSSPGRPGSTRP